MTIRLLQAARRAGRMVKYRMRVVDLRCGGLSGGLSNTLRVLRNARWSFSGAAAVHGGPRRLGRRFADRASRCMLQMCAAV